MLDLGAAIRNERLRMRLSQSELAAQVGVTRRAIAALEQSGGRTTTLVAVEPILRLNIKGLAHGDSMVERVRATRLRQKLSLRAAAGRSGLSVNTVREIESGRGEVASLLRLVGVVGPSATFHSGVTRSQKKGFVTVGRRISERHNPTDYFVTPAPVTRMLLDSEAFDQAKPILEPAVGEARAVDRVLRERGYDTVCFDLHAEGHERQDFLTLGGRYCSMVTNPPFSLHIEFVQRAKQIVDHKFALLMPVNYLIGAQRHAEIWADRDFPLARVHVLTRGVNFLASDPHGERFLPSQLYVAWFVFERTHIGPPEIRWLDCTPLIERKGQPKRNANSTASVSLANSNTAT